MIQVRRARGPAQTRRLTERPLERGRWRAAHAAVPRHGRGGEDWRRLHHGAPGHTAIAMGSAAGTLPRREADCDTLAILDVFTRLIVIKQFLLRVNH